MQAVAQGRAWKYGDNVNTDLIIPGKYLVLTDPRELARHAMEGLDPGFAGLVRPGDIIVAGKNFGCGSSREHAPLALKGAEVQAILAESVARIFFRNSINLGLLVLECPGISSIVEKGDEVCIDIPNGKVINLRTRASLEAKPLPEFIASIVRSGGLIPYLRQHLDEW